eukprot:3430737-Pyramimonas_sp.AAC.1
MGDQAVVVRVAGWYRGSHVERVQLAVRWGQELLQGREGRGGWRWAEPRQGARRAHPHVARATVDP